mgnify:CR=1 FL=1
MSDTAYPSVNDLTLEEKASLTSGGDAWHLQGVETKGIPGYMITDGPHGLRKSLASSTGETDLNDSVPATCFPPAAGLSSSWNPELIHRVGEAMGEECIQEKVAVILGPGVNIKRNPLGGRCFEYWSEDPYLAGHEAVGIVAGVQSKGVGTSLKHFAANSQETDRLRISANISQRALREIYFPAFEHIVKEAQPWTIMCAYNCINGVHAAQDRWLLTDVLRDEWGFQGIVMSDWGADHDRVASLNAGLNLEMPPSYTDDQIVYAARDGRIQPAQLDRMAQGMIDLVNKTRAAMSVENYRFDIEAHDEVAHQAAVESMVLLKNNGLLPLRHNLRRIAVLGPNADSPEVQLGNYNGFPSEIVTPLKGIRAKTGAEIVYLRASDYTTPEAGADEIRKAVEGADLVIYVGGISPRLEGEEGDAGREKLDGFLGGDRTGIMLPKVQTQVMQVVKQIGIPLVFVSMSGSAVAFPWEAENADAILQAWYGGQAAGTAVADILWGDCNPSGRLPVTFYADDEQLPDFNDYSMKGRTYRYFEGRPLYPFGYGLSYTTFRYDTPVCTAKTTVTGESVKVVTRVRNTGSVAGDEVVQLYVSHPDAPEPKPIRALKGVKRIHLQPGEEQIVEFTLTPRNLALVDVDGTTACCPGRISFYIGGSQPVSEADRRQHSAEIRVKGPRRVLAR